MKCAANAGVKGAFCDYGFGIISDSRCTARIGSMKELLRLLGDGK